MPVVCVVAERRLHPEVGRWFPGAFLMAPMDPTLGYRFDEIVMLWEPESVSERDWFNGLSVKMPRGRMPTFLISRRRPSLAQLLIDQADAEIEAAGGIEMFRDRRRPINAAQGPRR